MLVSLDLVVTNNEALTILALVKPQHHSSHHDDLANGTIIAMARD